MQRENAVIKTTVDMCVHYVECLIRSIPYSKIVISDILGTVTDTMDRPNLFEALVAANGDDVDWESTGICCCCVMYMFCAFLESARFHN